MKEIKMSPKMRTTLFDLFDITQGNTDEYREVIDVHHMTLKGLARRDLIDLDAQHVKNGSIRWYAALKKAGRELVIKDKRESVISESPDSGRNMQTIQLQLDQNREEHAAALEQIGELKSQRKFTQTIIQLLQLHESLLAGDTDLLNELYGLDQPAPAAPAPAAGRRDIIELKEFIQQQFQRMPAAASAGGGPKSLGGLNSLPPPTFDDDDDDLLEVTESTGGKSNATENFLKSVERLMNL